MFFEVGVFFFIGNEIILKIIKKKVKNNLILIERLYFTVIYEDSLVNFIIFFYNEVNVFFRTEISLSL